MVVTARKAPPGCAATVDRSRARPYRRGNGGNLGRPDAGAGSGAATDLAAPLDDRAAGANLGASANTKSRSAPVDSMPRPQDLDPDELGSIAPE